ncbi:AMP-binding protein [Pararobbsia silviterrae]|uniref:AMP-dependent synthetase/ligase domain-containing protein n=1 Tax=Pararobbsia silviterrae TaxID=1792498 RepID=A0A494XSK7_9BURK|nr:AMP-binding protein [Pararobbsia silviterrae]RKP53622.1 hypothetical protein D7S86_15220 [Pararobbsia silviterrae]
MEPLTDKTRIADAFIDHAIRSADAIALSSENGELTYAQLHTQSRKVAFALEYAFQYARRTPCVAILAERCADFVISLIGVTLGGATFVVLDSGYPDERLADLLGRCRPDQILVAGGAECARRGRALAQAAGLPVLVADDILYGRFAFNRHASDQAAREVRDAADDRAAPERAVREVAYYLFTSGSTGAPKCVAVSHAPLVHFVAWHIARAGITRDDRFSLVSGLSHDPVLRDIFTPLSCGARLDIPSEHTLRAPGHLRAWFFDKQIRVAHLTPSMGRLLVAQGRQASELPALRRVFWGGEPLTLDIVKQLDAIAPHVMQSNFYGSTETPQAICCHDIDFASATTPLPIGRPVEGFDVYIADENGIALPARRQGELCVRSPFLSLGYVKDGEIVSERVNGVYRTGDFGECDEAGKLIVTGRHDDQVKIRGYRIDLNEVTTQLSRIDGIAWCATLAIDDASGARLESFVTLAQGDAWREDAVQATLAARVPAYMIPARYHMLPDGPPLLPSGKVDRRALIAIARTPALDDAPHPASAYSRTEASLIEKWADVFPQSRISPRSSFTSLGGDSLSMVHAYLAAEEVLGPLPTNWADRPIADLARTDSKHVARPDRIWASLDSTIVIRCAAIVLIVLYHFGMAPIGKGLTGALFLISGVMFGTLKLPADLRDFDGRASFASMKRIFLPTLFFTLLVGAHDVKGWGYMPLAALLFSANWVDYYAAPHGYFHMRWTDSLFWYADCLLQMLALTTVAALLVRRVARRAVSIAEFAFALWIIGSIFRFAVPLIVSPSVLDTGIDDMHLHQINALSNLATFALGMGIAAWTRRAGRIWPTVLTVMFGVLDAKLYGPSNGVSIVVATLCVVYLPRLPVPRFTVGVIREISNAALYIYLAQFVFASIALHALGGRTPVVEAALALGGGIVISKIGRRVGRAFNAVLSLSRRRIKALGTLVHGADRRQRDPRSPARASR